MISIIPAIRRPLIVCTGYRDGWPCTRPAEHGGRHVASYLTASRRSRVVVLVWGDDVHKAKRERGRAAITAKANERLQQVVDRIAAGADPDEAWSTVEAEAAAS